MNNDKDLEEANKEVERSKVILHDSENASGNKAEEKQVTKDDQSEGQQEEGSGIFTADGKELPKIEGGYDLIDPGGSLGDEQLVSV